jgi:hypothetical protein
MLSVCADQRRDSTHICFTKFHSDETEAIEFTNSMTQQDEPIKRKISRRSTLCITWIRQLSTSSTTLNLNRLTYEEMM